MRNQNSRDVSPKVEVRLLEYTEANPIIAVIHRAQIIFVPMLL